MVNIFREVKDEIEILRKQREKGRKERKKEGRRKRKEGGKEEGKR
jgi:hypothetical protein